MWERENEMKEMRKQENGREIKERNGKIEEASKLQSKQNSEGAGGWKGKLTSEEASQSQKENKRVS